MFDEFLRFFYESNTIIVEQFIALGYTFEQNFRLISKSMRKMYFL